MRIPEKIRTRFPESANGSLAREPVPEPLETLKTQGKSTFLRGRARTAGRILGTRTRFPEWTHGFPKTFKKAYKTNVKSQFLRKSAHGFRDPQAVPLIPSTFPVTWPANLWLQKSLEIRATMSGISIPCFRRRARRSAAADSQCHVPAGWALPFSSAIHPTQLVRVDRSSTHM